LIQLSFSEIYHSIGNGENAIFNARSLKDSLHSIQAGINNIRNTNSFMLMTINRCIDYTKATKGMKLVPRYETIDLQETLQLPLSCMLNIQNRIEIKLKEIDMSRTCSHIITDKQWLQENVLCLLSNAVKYSSEGFVTVSVFLTDPTDSCKEVGTLTTSSNEASPTKDWENTPAVVSSSNSVSTGPLPMKNDHRTYSSPCIGLDRFSEHPPELVTGLHRENELPRFDKVYLRFEIEDTGIGMSDEAMASLFNAFKQTQRLAGGTGLGLYSLAKRMEAMNGRYGVMRRRDGLQGSLFWFSIPYRPDEAFARVAAKEHQDFIDAFDDSSCCSNDEEGECANYIGAMSSSFDNLEAHTLDHGESHESNEADSESSSQPKLSRSPFPENIVRESNVASTKGRKASTRASKGHLLSRSVSFTLSKSSSTDDHIVPLVPFAVRNMHSTITSSKNKPSFQQDLKILLVDDSPVIVKMTSMMLKRMGHQLTIAENGAMALKCVTEELTANNSSFHIVLMDLQMPVMDGLEATRRIRRFENEWNDKKLVENQPGHPKQEQAQLLQSPHQDLEPLHHLIVGMSANSDAETVDQAVSAGVDLFIPKPFNLDSFNTKIVSKVKLGNAGFE
jgi:CheY-like chemotaxis protein/signal transduction histidine kinase